MVEGYVFRKVRVTDKTEILVTPFRENVTILWVSVNNEIATYIGESDHERLRSKIFKPHSNYSESGICKIEVKYEFDETTIIPPPKVKVLTRHSKP